MSWILGGKIVAFAGTFLLMFFLLKELIRSIRESEQGRGGGRCDLD